MFPSKGFSGNAFDILPGALRRLCSTVPAGTAAPVWEGYSVCRGGKQVDPDAVSCQLYLRAPGPATPCVCFPIQTVCANPLGGVMRPENVTAGRAPLLTYVVRALAGAEWAGAYVATVAAHQPPEQASSSALVLQRGGIL